MLRQASKCVGHGRIPCTRGAYLGRRRKTNAKSDEGRFTNMANGQIENAYDGITDFEYRTHAKKRILSGFPLLDKLTKGFEVGCVTVWTGVSNVGKTTLLTAIINAAIEQNHKVFTFNGEQSREDFRNNLYIQSSAPEDLYYEKYQDTEITDVFVKEKRRYELDRKYAGRLFVYNNNAPRTINALLHEMEDAYIVHGVDVFVLDNFMQIDMQGSDILQEQSRVMEELRTFAVKKQVHIHLVAHPRKMQDFHIRLSMFDISGSMNVANKAYNIIAIERVDMMDKQSTEYQKLKEYLLSKRYDIEKTGTILEVLKTKGTACGIVPLMFDMETKAFKEQPELPSEVWEKKKHEKTESGFRKR